MTNTTEKKLRNILEYTQGVTTGITGDTPLYEMGLDSLDVIELTMEVEERFNIYFDDDEFDWHTTFDQAVFKINLEIEK